MQKLSHEVQLERSSDEEESNSDFGGQKFSHCEGCYISRGSSHQCGIHGYGGAPLQGWLLSVLGRRCQILSICSTLTAILILVFTMMSPQKSHFFWVLLIVFILSLITMLLLIWYLQGTIHRFRYPHTCSRSKEPFCL